MLIPRTAQKLDAVVTVIGTVARTGLSGALIGNTAEVVLDTLESDVLVLKPDDIIAHLEEPGQQGVTVGRTKKPPKGGFFAGDTAYLSIACRNEGAM